MTLEELEKAWHELPHFPEEYEIGKKLWAVARAAKEMMASEGRIGKMKYGMLQYEINLEDRLAELEKDDV